MAALERRVAPIERMETDVDADAAGRRQELSERDALMKRLDAREELIRSRNSTRGGTKGKGGGKGGRMGF